MAHSSDSESSSDILDAGNDEGWEDVEADEEPVAFMSLFDDKQFTKVTEMFQYCKEKFAFDIWRVHNDLDLDFLGAVKLVNYIREEVKSGTMKPDVSSQSVFDDEKYLKPTLADDAVLYSLDDVFDEGLNNLAKTEVQDLRDQLAELQFQFDAYRQEVQTALNSKLEEGEDDKGKSPAGNAQHREQVRHNGLPNPLFEADYFSSYSYNGVHESMLKDSIRTDAYRDFIYDNKDLFHGKVILDVGCGTGILSMFCAKAGAKLVIAVDNSDIIDKARQNVFENGFQETIKCLRGKIEEVVLPVPKVDIIVSEWMGYCLLYESMLDSVIYARDAYLATDGLMVPSHARILAAPLVDSELVASYIGFWRDVYGFNMTSMLEKAYDETLIRVVEPSDLATGVSPAVFLELDLHNAAVADLSFTKPIAFSIPSGTSTANQDEQALPRALEGLVLWFDMFFQRSRKEKLNPNLTVAKAKKLGMVAFSTGPETTPTHWMQGVLLMKKSGKELKEGEKVVGTIKYEKMAGQERSLDIEVGVEQRCREERKAKVGA